jgi:Bacterial CdiA-CT RNAse A domain
VQWEGASAAFLERGVVRLNRHLATALLLWLLVTVSSCQRPPQDASVSRADSKWNASGPVRDLSLDEAAGGHTLSRHVGRSDAELHERLQREPDISAASTYTDGDTAEHVVGATLQQAQSRIGRWLDRRNNHPNLVLNYRGDRAHPIGRTLHRGDSAPKPCSDAIAVLRWDGGRQYHVLTSYPECR